jgi:hypothetical protein
MPWHGSEPAIRCLSTPLRPSGDGVGSCESSSENAAGHVVETRYRRGGSRGALSSGAPIVDPGVCSVSVRCPCRWTPYQVKARTDRRRFAARGARAAPVSRLMMRSSRSMTQRRLSPIPADALTIGRMPALTASGSFGHASMMSAGSGSEGGLWSRFAAHFAALAEPDRSKHSSLQLLTRSRSSPVWFT